MSKYLVLILAFSLVVVLNTGLARAQSDSSADDPGILPSNPLYFLKEWGRGIKKLFTFSDIKEAELELNELNDRAAELKKLEEISPQNFKAITRASEKYQNNIERLKNRLSDIKETAQNSRVGDLLNGLIDNSLKHQQLFDELGTKLEEKNSDLKDKIDNSQEKITELVAEVSNKFETPELFQQKLKEIVENQPGGLIGNLRAVEIVDQIGNKLSGDKKEKVEELKDGLINAFKNSLREMKTTDVENVLSSDNLKKVVGDSVKRAQTLEEIKGEFDGDSVKEKIEIIRDEISKYVIKEDGVGADKIKGMIEEVKSLINKAETKLLEEQTSLSRRASAKELIEKSRLFLEKSETALANGNLGEAFGQITSARAAATNAIRQIQQDENSVEKEIKKEEKTVDESSSSSNNER